MNARSILSIARAITLASVVLGGCDPGDDPPGGDLDAAPPPPVCDLWYLDRDDDQHGDVGDPGVESCTPVVGRVRSHDDCDDTSPYVHPDQHELCDLLDNNCDGFVETASECAATDAGGCVVVKRETPASLYLLCPQTVGRTWSFARSACQNNGMDLARINDGAENTFVALSGAAAFTGFLWLGGNDLALEGTWRWLDDGSQFWFGPSASAGGVGTGYTNWWPSRPGISQEYNCLVMDPMNAPLHPWLDVRCTDPNGFVCERT